MKLNECSFIPIDRNQEKSVLLNLLFVSDCILRSPFVVSNRFIQRMLYAGIVGVFNCLSFNLTIIHY